MGLPVIPVALATVVGGALAAGVTGLAEYYRADWRTKDRYNAIVCRWLGIPIEDIAAAPEPVRRTWKQQLESASLRRYGKPFRELTSKEGEQLLNDMPPA